MTDDARLNELLCAVLGIIPNVRPRIGYLASLGVSKFDQKWLDKVLDEHHLELWEYEDYRTYKLTHENRNVRASFDVWVPMWEAEIKIAVDNLLPRIADA